MSKRYSNKKAPMNNKYSAVQLLPDLICCQWSTELSECELHLIASRQQWPRDAYRWNFWLHPECKSLHLIAVLKENFVRMFMHQDSSNWKYKIVELIRHGSAVLPVGPVGSVAYCAANCWVLSSDPSCGWVQLIQSSFTIWLCRLLIKLLCMRKKKTTMFINGVDIKVDTIINSLCWNCDFQFSTQIGYLHYFLHLRYFILSSCIALHSWYISLQLYCIV